MSSSYDFKKVRRFITIYAVVQALLFILLVLMALYFQAGLQSVGNSQLFMKSVIISLVIQLALFFPLSKFATREAKREVDACATDLSPEQLKAFRNSRTLGDVIKSAFFVFFITFLLMVPAKLLMHQKLFFTSLIFFSFILTALSYLQNYNFAVKRLIKEKQPAVKS